MSVWVFSSLPICAGCGQGMMYIMETFPDGSKSTIKAWCVKEACSQMGKKVTIKAVEIE